jgi:hypothetical protein
MIEGEYRELAQKGRDFSLKCFQMTQMEQNVQYNFIFQNCLLYSMFREKKINIKRRLRRRKRRE